ncbi:phosphopantetheine-binding protein [Orientia tsutsugamushi]|uniref:phosphopantetheine-binding protein n=1 Tax=Orientia tsutsugamushi TaxID=784 RepID=UPI0035295E1B
MRANAHQEDKNNEFLYEDYIKNTIINIWQEAFGIKEVRLEDDFFDLGGDSLAALQFIAEIKKKLNLELELVNIKYPTLQNIIEILSNQSKSGDKEKSNLILIKKGSRVTLLSLILVHPIGGDIYFYRDLASCLPEE